ncbi:MAG: hypothetical protein LBK61_06550 [Spirochaetaceae bacterium]|nr:hypothetical protein [Spirochaetaceae bacterium]
MVVPAGGENPQGFHPFVKPLPVLAGRAAAWQGAPAGGENPAGFSSLREASPQFWSKEQRHGSQSTPLRRLCFPFGRAMPP